MTELTHAVQFLQVAFTILLSLALGEAFKQLVPDGEKDMAWDRFWSLVAFVLMIFPFFHGMTRHFYITYLAHPDVRLREVAIFLMFDGVTFLLMSAAFFVMSRSLRPNHWTRFFITLSILLTIDSVWSGISIWRGIDLWNFIYLNLFLFVLLLLIGLLYRNTNQSSRHSQFSGPPFYCALACLATTIVDYFWMQDFFFSKS